MIINNEIHNGGEIINKLYLNNFKDQPTIYSNVRLLIIKIFNIIILIIAFSLFYTNIYYNIVKSKDISRKYLNMKFDTKNVSFNKSINYIKNCISPYLFKFQPISSFKLEDPKISVVVPLFNCEKFLLRAVKSIQYQNISNIEIILIEDYSKDNTLSIVEKIQKEDKRIRIIRNKKNMGVLYSRSIGVLSSKGKYLSNAL